MLAIGIFMNNEVGLDGHWFTRNIATALGYYAFQSGAYTHEVLGDLITKALLRGALIVLTTIHAQDFQDVPGDRIQGRKTLPIVAPVGSRISMILFLLTWSMWLGALSTALSHIFLLSAAVIVGSRFLLFRSVPSDRLSYILYNHKFNYSIVLDSETEFINWGRFAVWMTCSVKFHQGPDAMAFDGGMVSSVSAADSLLTNRHTLNIIANLLGFRFDPKN
ncbi:uncharacterized protein BT62DRAFT_1081744 [Guyanagaster necrorhizus]|uniref:Uncharacterized protein n=1 Tax=Guyanagaster necrorhizus TaxID=856835 RepID=A0A9P7VE06_9AGAR|nr:uncharacterized protein BT62DRAFT_1081744 [Guyanagaster necrorhizus MCA 3950]KAG7439168.1 hypothetical protein BT62DRAFT_1081744 [Guyanagaster necrorhizus MCA 3950]